MRNFECVHCLDHTKNAIEEEVIFCELWGEWKNVTLGDCIGNCESQKELYELLKDDN